MSHHVSIQIARGVSLSGFYEGDHVPEDTVTVEGLVPDVAHWLAGRDDFDTEELAAMLAAAHERMVASDRRDAA